MNWDLYRTWLVGFRVVVWWRMIWSFRCSDMLTWLSDHRLMRILHQNMDRIGWNVSPGLDLQPFPCKKPSTVKFVVWSVIRRAMTAGHDACGQSSDLMSRKSLKAGTELHPHQVHARSPFSTEGRGVRASVSAPTENCWLRFVTS